MKYAPGRPVYCPALVSSTAAVNRRAGGDSAVHQTPTPPRCPPNISPHAAIPLPPPPPPPPPYIRSHCFSTKIYQEAQMSCLQRVMAVSVLQETASSRVSLTLCSFFLFRPCLDFSDIKSLQDVSRNFPLTFPLLFSNTRFILKSDLRIERRCAGYPFVSFVILVSAQSVQ